MKKTLELQLQEKVETLITECKKDREKLGELETEIKKYAGLEQKFNNLKADVDKIIGGVTEKKVDDATKKATKKAP